MNQSQEQNKSNAKVNVIQADAVDKLINAETKTPKISDITGIKVSRVILHQAYDIPGAGTVDSISEARHKGIQIICGQYWTTFFYKGKWSMTPNSNIAGVYA